MTAPRQAPGQLPAPAAGGPDWRAWAPPLDPPAAGGLPEEQAEAIAADWWDIDPHEAAARMWEDYAATLPISNAVSQVATGSQSVTYSPPRPGGSYGEAIARAEWHRSFSGTLGSAPLEVAPPGIAGAPPGWGWPRL